MALTGISIRFKYFSLPVFLCIVCYNAQAQYETANWIFSEYTLSFVNENPVASSPVMNSIPAAFASYSSDVGKLLISTDGSTVWNGNGEIMKNGENITSYRTNSIIIPKPGSDNQFYIFSYNAFNVPGNNNNMLSVIVYAVVDLNGDNKKGEVMEKNKVLYNNMHGTFTISGKCDRSVFWLVGDVDSNLQEGTDKIYTFQIDKNGIAGPFTSKPLIVEAARGFKLSPDAKKFLFTISEPSGTGTLISDFNPGNLPQSPIVNVNWLPANGSGEFSSNSRFVYLVTGKQLIQYDIQTKNFIILYESPVLLGVPQMAANGKIYIPVDGTKKLMVINEPDFAGVLCDFDEAGISIPRESFVLPVFASNLFYKGTYPANAGSDKTVCSGESVMIGSLENTATNFSWAPTTYLDDPNKLQPTFHFTGSNSQNKTFVYKLTTYFEGCSHSDLVTVGIVDKPLPPVIYGSRSVCPGVKDAQYWTDKTEGFTYLWSVRGGLIDGKSDLDSLLINWGSSNQNAQVQLQAIDPQGCNSDVATITVGINAQLQTETPQGLDSVCMNRTGQHKYHVTKTTGSLYTWGILGGEIISSQGKNEITVNWASNTEGKIWVTEQSVTDEAVCTGESDTLNITVFKDPAAVRLEVVSVDDIDDNRIHLVASAAHSNRIKEMNILNRKEGVGIWEIAGNVEPSPIIQSSFDNFLTDDYVYEFQVSYVNGCDELSSSYIHKTIRLTAEGNEERNLIDLHWSSYNFWTDGNVNYEVLSSITDPKEFHIVEKLLTDTSATISAEESFQYSLKVKAVRSDGLYVSLSNEIEVEFQHDLFIPNVITPNQDGFNDTFEIKNIRLYPENRLVIFNRYGKSIYDQTGYQGKWDADDLSTGIYYFILTVPDKTKEYKGWLHVVR